jgi:hypothetical protein
MFIAKQPPEPWHSFLRELDDLVSEDVRLDCIGGFVVTQIYGLPRPTADIDVIELAPRQEALRIMEVASQGGPLHRKYRIYLDRVGVALVPEDYEDRLVEIFIGVYRHLRLMALDPYDIAMSKLERNSQKDRDDVRHLAATVPFDLKRLEERYTRELRWQLGNPQREDLTMRLWIEMLNEKSSR